MSEYRFKRTGAEMDALFDKVENGGSGEGGDSEYIIGLIVPHDCNKDFNEDFAI